MRSLSAINNEKGRSTRKTVIEKYEIIHELSPYGDLPLASFTHFKMVKCKNSFVQRQH